MGEDTIAAFFFLRFQFVLSMVRKDGSMRLFSYLSVAVLLVSSVVLTAYSPDLLSMVIVGFMCMITLAGCIYGLLPTISFTGGLLNGQNSIRKASGTEGSSAWVAALRIERFFQQKRLDKLFGEYREKVQHQRETGQIVSDIDEVPFFSFLPFTASPRVLRCAKTVLPADRCLSSAPYPTKSL